ncbi:MAG: hypothetical protein KA118_19740, partial [Verrucomicrobia bacterium]|nr:hypothetical protein [Verrucomicrobiota bacterium]
MKRSIHIMAAALVFGWAASALGDVTGQWEFNGDLSASIGIPLEAQGIATVESQLGTTAQLGVADIGGEVAHIMRFPAMPTPADGYMMFPNADANGSTTDVNQYSIVMDILYPASSGGYRALFQTSASNGNDADWFVNGSNGLGINQAYNGNLTPDTWHRIALVVDLEQTDAAKKFLTYIDGTLAGSSNLGGDGSPGGRYAVWPASSSNPSWIFADNDGETAVGYVNSLQFWDRALSAPEIAFLGGPAAAGIPSSIPVQTNLTVTVTPTNQVNVTGMTGNHFTADAVGSGTLTYQWYRDGVALPGQTAPKLRLSNVQLADAGHYTVVVNNGTLSVTSSPPAVLSVQPAPPTRVTGQWDFNEGDLKATIGQPLQFFDAQVQADVQFYATTIFGISEIDGQAANVMLCNPSTANTTNWNGLIMTHGISPNGGGARVNQYTVIIDLLYPTWSSGFYRGLWQTDPANTNDADVFFNRSNGLGISSIYNGELALDTWHRVVLAFDLTKREFGQYIDGTNVLTEAKGDLPYGPNDAQYLFVGTDPDEDGGVDMRWSLGPTALLLADDDGEIQPVYVSSIQVRSGRMTDAAIAA